MRLTKCTQKGNDRIGLESALPKNLRPKEDTQMVEDDDVCE